MREEYVRKGTDIMYKVSVLMSTYNGAKYIKEQIDSIFMQNDVLIELIIRDDGSTDNTIEIIRSMKARYNNIVLIEGVNVGCEKSFQELMKIKRTDAEYYAFADQDDYWEPDKLITCISAISESKGYALAGCNLLACNTNMEPIKIIHSDENVKSIEEKKRKNFLCNLHGCVLVWNSKLHEALNEFVPSHVFAHDVWVCAVANAIGEFKIIRKPYIKYRIHETNVSGLATNKIQRMLKGISLYLGHKHPERDLIAKELLCGYDRYMDKTTEGYLNLKLLKNYKKNWKTKMKFIRSSAIQSIQGYDKYFWILCICLGKY